MAGLPEANNINRCDSLRRRFGPAKSPTIPNKCRTLAGNAKVVGVDSHNHILPQPITVIERDDGMFQIGFADDAPGPFSTRQFAAAVAAQQGLAA